MKNKRRYFFMNFIRKYLHKGYIALKSMLYYRNFFEVWKNYLGLINQDYLIVRLWNGFQYKMRSSKNSMSDAYIINATYLYGVHDGLKKAMQEARVGIDIGAHIGVVSIFAASLNPLLKIYAYEPAPDNFKLLKENIILNRLERRIIANQLAVVGSEEKERGLYLVGGRSECYTIDVDYLAGIKDEDVRGRKDEKVMVGCATLSDIFESHQIAHCDFLKIDCEGAEFEILLNANHDILKRIRFMSIEYHHHGLRVEQLKEFLESNGFKVIFPDPNLDVLVAQNTLIVK